MIEKGKEIDKENVSELITDLRDLMRHGGIKLESVHIELLLRNLVRDLDDITKIPDWSKPNPQYQITSIHNGIMMSSSIINAITFERLKDQLKSPISYRKTDTCFIDRLFVLN